MAEEIVMSRQLAEALFERWVAGGPSSGSLLYEQVPASGAKEEERDDGN